MSRIVFLALIYNYISAAFYHVPEANTTFASRTYNLLTSGW